MPVAVFNLDSCDGTFDSLWWQERKDREPRRRDPEREPFALVQHERSDREASVVTEEAHGLRAPACRKKRALSRRLCKGEHVFSSGLGDVVSLCGDRAEEKHLGPQHPVSRGVNAINQPLRSQRVEESMSGGTRDARRSRGGRRGDTLRSGGSEAAKERGDPAHYLGSLNSSWGRIFVHIMNNITRILCHVSKGLRSLAMGSWAYIVWSESEIDHIVDIGVLVGSKYYDTASEALMGIVRDGMTIAVGGFGLCGIPRNLIVALRESEARELTIVSNNMGVDGKGLGLLLENHQVSKVLASYVGENRLFAEQYLSGALDVEFVPQGTLAERIRAGGAGIPAFYTPTGVGTPIAAGKSEAEFDGRRAILERGIAADIALVRAHEADREGNLRYRLTARNFNPLVAMSGRVTLAEVERISDTYLDPECIDTPGVFVQRLVRVQDTSKDIEQRTVRVRQEA